MILEEIEELTVDLEEASGTEGYDDTKIKEDIIALKEQLNNITVPTKISELENDEGYLKKIPEGYATEEFVQEKINEIEIPTVPDISNFVTETDMNIAISTAISNSITNALESDF